MYVPRSLNKCFKKNDDLHRGREAIASLVLLQRARRHHERDQAQALRQGQVTFYRSIGRHGAEAQVQKVQVSFRRWPVQSGRGSAIRVRVRARRRSACWKQARSLPITRQLLNLPEQVQQVRQEQQS